jgi:putative flippase GtrA
MNRWLNPVAVLQLLRDTRYLHFFVVGMSGVAMNLGITAGLTELAFGREHYFSAYLIGLGANLLYNFVLHTRITFRTSGGHARRLAIFLAYSLVLAYVQARVTKALVAWLGVDWYLVVIPSVILVFSVITFVIFKFILFKEEKPQEVLEESVM